MYFLKTSLEQTNGPQPEAYQKLDQQMFSGLWENFLIKTQLLKLYILIKDLFIIVVSLELRPNVLS